MLKPSIRALITRHRIPIILCATVIAAGMILPACGGDPSGGGVDAPVPTTIQIIVTSTPGTGPVIVGSTRSYRIEVRDQFGVVMGNHTLAAWSIVGNATVATVVLQGSTMTDNSGGLATCLTQGGVLVQAVRNTGSGTLTATTALECMPAPPPTSGSITIVKDAQPNSPQEFSFASNQPSIPSFVLVDDTDPTRNRKVFAGLTPTGYTITEAPVSGWKLMDIVCAPASSATTNLTAGTATITLAAGAAVTCTFINAVLAPVITVLTTNPTAPTTSGAVVLTITGTNFNSATARINVTGPGCGPCTIANSALTTKSPTTLAGSLTLTTPGTFEVTVQNGSEPVSNVKSFVVASPTRVATTMALVVTSTPATGTVLVGGTRQFAIEVRDQFNAVLPGLTSATWSIAGAASGSATITQAGLATCVSPGTATVRAIGPAGPTGANLIAETPLQCEAAPNPAASIVLAPWTFTTTVGGNVTATASFIDAGGLPTSSGCPVAFSLPDAPSLASVTSSGLTATVTGLNAGTTTLQAACTSGPAAPARARLQVTAPPLNVAKVVMATPFMFFPESADVTTFRFVAIAQGADGAAIPGAPIVYSISGGSAASIDQTGNVTISRTAGGAAGPALRGGATITATSGGQREIAHLTYGNAGSIRGQVRSTRGQYVGRTTASVTIGATVVPADVNNDGIFYFTGLPAGTYTVTVQFPILGNDVGQIRYTEVSVVAGRTTEVGVTTLARPLN